MRVLNRLVTHVLLAGALVALTATNATAATITYWSLFNVEGESTTAPAYVTYATLADMLNDENRAGIFLPDGFAGGLFAGNVVGSGSDGTTYWSLFNVEGESTTAPAYVTYATLADMLNDENRAGVFVPDGFAGGTFAANIVGSGAFVIRDSAPIPTPGTAWMLVLALTALCLVRRRGYKRLLVEVT